MKPISGQGVFSLSSFFILTVVALGFSTPRTVVAGSAPAITTQPRNQTNLLSANATFNVVASGQTPLFYQWSFKGANLVDSAHIGGATNATLVVSSVTAGDAGNYLVLVSNSHGSAVSSNATLTVLIPASITSPPASQSVLVGSNATFTASATSTAPLSYQWYFNGAPLVDGGRVNGSATTNLNLSNIQTNDAGAYQLVVTNNYGSATSAVTALTVLVPPFITTQPSNQIAVLSSNAIFTVTAAGTAPLSYQWYFNGSPLADGGQISGAAATNLTISNLQFTNSGSYVLIVTNPVGSVTSAVAVLTVGAPPAIVQQPVNQVAQWAAAASFSVVATGTPPLNYQWSFNGTNLNGATNATLTLTNLQPSQAGNSAVTITNAFGSIVSSNATLTVNLPPPGVPFIAGFSPLIANPGATVTIFGTNFSSGTSNNTVFFGAVQAALLSASVTNLVVTVPRGATFGPITETVGGLTAYANAPFLPTFFSSGIFTNSSLGPQLVLPAGSGPIKVVIADLDGDGKPDLIVGNDYGNTISLYRNISTNGSLTTASFALPVTLVTPPGSYSPFGLAVADVDGDGKPDIIVSDYNQSLVSVYRNTSTPGNLSSNSFATRVDFATGPSPQGVEVRDLDGDGKPDLLVANSGDGTVSLFRNTGVVGSLTANSFAPRVDIPTGAGCDHVAVADLDGDGLPDIVTANNGAGTLSVLRNLSTPGSLTASSFAPAVNLPILSEPVQLTIGDLDGDGKPDIIVTFYLPQTTVSVLRNISTVGSLTTNSFAPRVDFPLGGRGHTPALADLDGSGKPDLAVVTELNSLLSIFRNVSAPGSFTSSSLAPRIDFATGYNAWGMAIGDLDGDGRPDIVFANSYDNTISIYQNEVPFGGPPVISVSAANTLVVLNGLVQLTGTVIGQSPLSYQWYFNGTSLTDNGRITGSATGTLSISNALFSDAGNYYFVVTNSLGAATSSVAMLTVLVPATITAQPTNQTVLLSSNVSFTATAAGTAPLNFQWYFNGVPLTDGGGVSGSARTNLNLVNVQTNDAGSYQLVVTNNYSAATSEVATLTVLTPPAILHQPANQAAQWGASAVFSVVANGTMPVTYQWTFNGANLAGASNSVLLLNNLQPSQAGNYAVTITNAFGSIVSSNATLTVNLPPPGVPFIAGFSPLIANPGATVTIFGTNFSSGTSNNTVFFGAVQAALLSASVTNLVVTVPRGATFGPITETVGGLTAYANAPFLPTFFSSGIFTNTSLGPQIVLPAGSGPNKVVIADLDGDGKPDLIVGNDYGNTISLYRNISTNGSLTTASFAPPVNLATPPGSASPYGLVVADVDGDGKLDIIVSDYNQSLMSVYRNTSTPGNLSSNSFATRVDFATGANPQGVEVRDLDGDGKPDLLVANSGDGTVSLFRNTGVVGSLTANSFAPRVDIPTGAGCDHVAVADLDGDGLPDIVTANNGAGTLSVLRNLSTPGSLTASSFAPAVNLPILSEPVQLAIGDLDGDGGNVTECFTNGWSFQLLAHLS